MCDMSVERRIQLPLSPFRSTEDGTQQRYAEVHAAHKDGAEKRCVFCEPQPDEILDEGDNIYALQNIFPYEQWDRFQVRDHALIVPKLHVHALSDLPPSVRVEWIDMVMAYEDRGYSNYTRGPYNPNKSQFHYHTHVIALGARALSSQHYDVESYSNKMVFED